MMKQLRLGLPLDAISEGTVYEIQIESLFPLQSLPELIETDLKTAIHDFYNKCVTAVDQDFLDAAIKQIKFMDLFQTGREIFKISNAWMRPQSSKATV